MNPDEYFRAERAQYARIAAADLQAYFDGLPNKKLALQGAHAGRLLCCSDERLDISEPCVSAAGALLLSEWNEADAFCREAKVTSIKSHVGCDEAAIRWRRLNGTIPYTPEELDLFADQETAKMAESLGIQYGGQIGAEHLKGSREVRLARTIYYVGVENFNPRALPDDLPHGLVVTRIFREPQAALADAELACSTILGERGYGNLITEDEPLTVVVVGGRWDDTASMLDEEISWLVSRQQGRAVIEKLLI